MDTVRHGCRIARPPPAPGFTLVELLVCLSMMLLLGVVSMDYLPHFLQESRMQGEVNRFFTALQLGRSEAVKHGRRVVLCPSPDLDQCGNSLDWPAGWILFPSDDRQHDAYEQVLQAGNPMEQGILMRSGNARSRIVFQPDGSSGGSNSSFTFCAQRQSARPRVICLSGSGRPRVSFSTCSRQPITCP